MSRATHRSGGQAPAAGAARQNDYFVPRDGIDREVITADICRYLGNDALVRPGTYENPQNGALIQGYFITAYRNLTTAMIEDLKADSARWEQERRAHSRNAQYRYSETHSARQQTGPTGDSPQYGDAYAREYDQPRYPGSGSAGYTGASSNNYGQPAAYGGQGGGYPGYGASVPPAYASQQDPRFAQGPMMNQGYPTPDVYASGSNRPVAVSDPRYDPYGSASNAGRDRIPTTMVTPQGGMYATTAAQVQQAGYPATTQAQGPAQAYYQQVQVPTTGNAAYAPVQPADPFYGRASSATPQGFAAGTQGTPQQQQYDETPSIPRTTAPSSSTQMASSGTTSSRRDTRESDRHSTERRHRPNHRP